ncbi:MAG: MarR family transcriptional regulator [Aeromonas sp.]
MSALRADKTLVRHAAVLEFFRQHGAMTVSEAIERGILHHCHGDSSQGVTKCLRRLIDDGYLSRRQELRTIGNGTGAYAANRQAKIYVYRLKG